MKKRRIHLRIKIYPVLWTGIIIVSIYLLVRFAALSFSEDFGQASSLKEVMTSTLCRKVIESGSSLIRYTVHAKEDTFSFPINLVSDEFALWRYSQEESLLTAKAQEYSSYPLRQVDESTEAMTNSEENLEVVNERLGYDDIVKGYLSTEYILTNGALFEHGTSTTTTTSFAEEDMQITTIPDQLQIGYLEGDVPYQELEEDHEQNNIIETVNPNITTEYTMEQLSDVTFLIRHFYIVDRATKVTEKLFDAEKLLGKDMTLKQTNDKPQILIYHTHSQEGYSDSRAGKEVDTVVGVGTYLAQILKEDYGYNVIHDTSKYDTVDGRNKAYNFSIDGITKILEDNPSIEVVIDLHRDSSDKRSTFINGEETAQIMLFNGLSRDQNGPITYLDNPNLQDNLAFSLQMQLKARELYPGLFYKNYLKHLRFNMHVRPKCLLVELGTYKNSLQSAKNAMKPFAEVLDAVLKGK